MKACGRFNIPKWVCLDLKNTVLWSSVELSLLPTLFSSPCLIGGQFQQHENCLVGTTSLGPQQSTFHFMAVLSTMITIIMLEGKAKATLLQSSHTVITFMGPIRWITLQSSTLFSHSSIFNVDCWTPILLFLFLCLNRAIDIRRSFFQRYYLQFLLSCLLNEWSADSRVCEWSW